MSDPSLTSAVTSVEPVAPTAPRFGQFVSGVALTFGTRVLMLVGLLGSSILVAHWLGPKGFGTLAVLNATVALTLQIASAGLPSANTYFIARDRRNLGPVWANAVMFALVVGSLAALVIFALGKLKPSLLGGAPTTLLGIAALSVPFQLLILVGLNVLLAVDRIGQMNLLECLSPAFSLLNAMVALVILGAGLTTLVAFNTGAAVVVSFFLLVAVGKVLWAQDDRRAARPDLSLLRTMLRYAIKFYISIMAGFVIFRADLLIVNYFRGTAEAGVYAVASQVSFLLLMLPGVIATLLFPRVASQPDPRAEFAVQVTRNASFMMLVICLVAAAGSFVLPLVYGAGFADATMQLLILLPGVYLVGLESVLVQHFTGTDLPVAIPGFWIVTVLANLALNLALVPAFGARAAALNSSLSYALIFVLVAWYFCRKTGRRPGEIFVPRAGDVRQLFARLVRHADAGQNRLR